MTVAIAYLSGGTVHEPFMRSMLEFRDHDRDHHQHHNPGGRIIAIHCGGLLARDRNTATQIFLDGGDEEWLWWIDTDQTFPPDTLHRLLEAAHLRYRPIISGVVFREATPGIYTPSFNQLDPNNRAAWPQPNHLDGRIMRAAWCGAGCLLTHRAALETIAGLNNDPWPWFGHDIHANQRLPEDITFSLRAAAAHIPIHIHTGVTLGHLKTREITVDDYLTQKSG